jgi:hypothetical protein
MGEGKNEAHGQRTLRWIFAHVVMPTLTGYLAYRLLHSRLAEFAKRLPEPYGDILADPLAENIISLAFSGVYFLLGFFKRRPGVLATLFLFAIGIADFLLGKAGKLSGAVLVPFNFAMLSLGLSVLILVIWYGSTEEESEDAGRELVTPWGGAVYVDVGFGKVFLSVVFIVNTTVGTVFLGLMLWKTVGMSGLLSVLGSCGAFVLLMIGLVLVWKAKLTKTPA